VGNWCTSLGSDQARVRGAQSAWKHRDVGGTASGKSVGGGITTSSFSESKPRKFEESPIKVELVIGWKPAETGKTQDKLGERKEGGENIRRVNPFYLCIEKDY